MNALNNNFKSIFRGLSSTTALGLLAMIVALSGTAISQQSQSQAPLGGDRLSLRAERVVSGIEMLESTVNTYRSFGGDVYLVRLREPVEQVMRDSGFLDFIGLDHVLPQEGAIEYLFDEVLDPAVCCYECEHRVFAECQALEKYSYRAQVPPISRVSLDSAHVVAPEDFRAMADDPGTRVLDIREPEEFARGHIPGAQLTPLRTVLDVGPTMARDRRLLLACRSGRRTQRAMHMLVSMGFEDVYGLRGGILAWRADGMPIAVDEGPMPGE